MMQDDLKCTPNWEKSWTKAAMPAKGEGELAAKSKSRSVAGRVSRMFSGISEISRRIGGKNNGTNRRLLSPAQKLHARFERHLDTADI